MFDRSLTVGQHLPFISISFIICLTWASTEKGVVISERLPQRQEFHRLGPTRYAIFSDVHNHTTALKAMLQDVAARKVKAYLCLGDTGIDACVNLVRNVGAETVFGNWEVSGWRSLSPANQRWTLNLPPVRQYADFWFSHAAPAWPQKITSLQSFLQNRHQISFSRAFPAYLNESNSLWQAFSELMAARVPLFFHGHTHRQTVWTFTPDNEIKRGAATNFALLANTIYIIGVGSVGQPRDIPQPGYVIFDSVSMGVEFVRLGQL